MVNKKEIVMRVVVFSTVYTLIAAVVVSYLKREWLLIPLLVVIGLWGVFSYHMNVKVMGRPVLSMEIEGLEGRALTDVNEEGKVKVRGEIWNARSDKKILKGKKVRILVRDGIVLEVESAED